MEETTTPLLTRFDADELAALKRFMAEEGHSDAGAVVRLLVRDELIRMGLLGVR